jgi:methylenetetrahydrofolate dehydrogenase (NADP+)/methenyltetrahydrofolate cyclohydrolase
LYYKNKVMSGNPKHIDGKAISDALIQDIARQTQEWVDRGGKRPHLSAVLIGNDGASETYVANKHRMCETVGFTSSLVRCTSTITQEQLMGKINKLNQDPEVDGFIVQLPLPRHISELHVVESILPSKDVDGFHPSNIGRMALNLPAFLPATPFGIVKMLEHSGIATEGKHVVVVGRSHIVGSPVSILLARNSNPGNCTVTLCHSKTKNLETLCSTADILVAALGKPLFIGAQHVGEGAVVIDVGIHRIPDATTPKGYRLCGDVDYEAVLPICSRITPVPGGVGPMTIVSLLANTLDAARGTFYPKR